MKYLHTMIRVGNLDKSIQFYTQVLGLNLVSRKDYKEGEFTLVFLGLPSYDEPFLELTHNWGVEKYDLGTAYGHMAFGVSDIRKTCDAIAQNGGKIIRPPGPMKHGSTVIAFVEDPDGYKIELIEKSTI